MWALIWSNLYMYAFKKIKWKISTTLWRWKKGPLLLRVQNVLSMTVMKTFATIVSEINLSTYLLHMMWNISYNETMSPKLVTVLFWIIFQNLVKLLWFKHTLNIILIRFESVGDQKLNVKWPIWLFTFFSRVAIWKGKRPSCFYSF